MGLSEHDFSLSTISGATAQKAQISGTGGFTSQVAFSLAYLAP